MKKMGGFALGMLLVCLLGLLPGTNALRVSADGPVTYTIQYVESAGEWRFQPNYPWDDQGYHRELYYLHQDMKDGDKLVVMASGHDLLLELTQHLSNLTFENTPNAVVSANGIDECFVLKDSVAAISGNVTRAYVYDNARCTFNQNVEYLEISGSFPLKATVSVGGTVGHLLAKDYDRVHYEFYQFAAGTLSIVDGALKTDAANYSTQPGQEPAAAPEAVTSAPAAPAAEASTESAAPAAPAADEYDEVPKTGDTTSYVWLLGIAAVCLLGGYRLRRSR